MEGDFAGDSFDIEKEGGGETNYSPAVDGVISIPCIDRLLQLSGGEGMFSNESPIETGDTCATVNEGMGVDGIQGV